MLLHHTCTILVAAAICFFSQAQVNITGTVTDSGTTTAIQGAIVSLASGNVTSISDNVGHYALGGSVAARRPSASKNTEAGLGFSGSRLHFRVPGASAQVRIDAFTLSGRRIGSVFDRVLAQGEYDFDPFSGIFASQVCLLRMQIGGSVTVLKVHAVGRLVRGAGELLRQKAPADGFGRAKSAAAVDTIIAWAVGYDEAKLAIDSRTGTYNLALRHIVSPGTVQVIQSTNGNWLAAMPSLAFVTDDGAFLPTITVTPSVTYQSIVGFGASFTESSVFLMSKMSAAKKNEILNAFFNPYTGAGYSLTRTPINSCDFALSNYSYDDTPGDYELTNFNMGHELQWKIPRILDAQAVPGSNFKLYGSPWSPPGWMKESGQMNGGGALKQECYAAWALYFSKFITTMKSNGVAVWGITLQNEPEFSPPWDGCVFTPQQQRDFLKNNVGPQLKKDGIDVKIMIFDHNKDHIVTWADAILGDAAAAPYVWGVAYHWYSGDQFENLGTVHDHFPGTNMIASECCLFNAGYNSQHILQTKFDETERMAHSIIGDINHWSNGYLTWNLVTDMQGWPCHVPMEAVAPIMVDTATDYVQYNSELRYMTHFSKYVRPGAVRIDMNCNNANLEVGAFKNTNGSIVVVVLNRTANAIAFKIKQGAQIIKPTIPAHAIIDFVYLN